MADIMIPTQGPLPLAPIVFLENSDLPNLGAVVTYSTPTIQSFIEPKRVSRLPPLPTVPGPSQYKRYYYIAVRRGCKPGVYSAWADAEAQIVNHPDPFYKTFSTRLAAEAFVAGWDGAGRHALPASSPRPLREHLAMSFPSAVPMPQSKRPSYHAKLLSPEEFGGLERAVKRASYRNSMVKVSSPLRQQVDDEMPVVRKTTSLVGLGGLLSPPASPQQQPQRWSVLDRERPLKPRTGLESGQWAATPHREYPGTRTTKGLLSPPTSPPTSPRASTSSLALSSLGLKPGRASGMWAGADSVPSKASPLSQESVDFFEGKSAPKKFSRSSLKASGVIMPVAAPRPPPQSIYSKINASTTSLAAALPRKKAQDRLSTLAENTRRELQLNEEGFASASLTPPRPAFMRRSSSSSLNSDSSERSMASLTSASSVQSSSLESYPIIEEPDIVISCTKSDGDAEGSVESSSLKSAGTVKKKGGLFKKFTKVLKIDKKVSDGRRPSM